MQQQLYQKHDWLLLKARYYLELAQINTHWSKDPETSIALLQQADTLLAAIADQQLFSVRQTIAKDIAQLQALPKIDIAGLLSQLDAIQTLIANLPLKLPFNSPSINAEEKNTTSTWQERLKQNMHSLKKLVVIRRHEENFKPLLSPTYHALLCESIQLNLQQAQWAILQNNPAIYQLSLSQALKEIKQTFDENAQETQSLVKQIQVLQQVKLVVPNPDIDESLLLLNQAIAAKTSPLETTSNPQGEKAK